MPDTTEQPAATTVNAPKFTNPAAEPSDAVKWATDRAREIEAREAEADTAAVRSVEKDTRFDLNAIQPMKASSKEDANLTISPQKEYPDNAKSEKAKLSFDALKTERDEWKKKHDEVDSTWKTKNSELEKQLLEIKSQYDPDAFKKYKDQNLELTTTIRRLNVTKHPDFIQKFDKPIEDAVAKAKTIVPQEKHALVERLLRLPDSPDRDSDIQSLIETLPPFRQIQFGTIYDQATSAVAARNNALVDEGKWVEQEEVRQKADQERRVATSKKAAEDAFQKALGTWDASVFGKKEGDEEHNKAAEERLSRARNVLFGNISPEEIAQVALQSSAIPYYEKTLKEAAAEIERLTAIVDKSSSRSQGKTTESAAKEQPEDAMSWVRRREQELLQG